MKKILSTDTFDNWLFVKKRITRMPWNSNEELPITLENQTELKNSIMALIENAKECIKLCSFILTDEDVIQALLKKIETSDCCLFIITQLDPSKFSASLLTDEEIHNDSNKTHIGAINLLHNQGAHIRAAENVHAKFIIVDNQITLITSANITSPSLNKNPESGIYLDQDSSGVVSKLFDLIYRFGTTYNQFIKTGSGRKFISHTNFSLSVEWLPKNQKNFIYTLGDLNHTIYSRLIELIDEANDFITMSSYCIIGLENLSEFTEAIQNAINRGVDIKVFCRGMNYRPLHIVGCTQLADLGCKIYGDVFNHSKGLSNENRAMIFTANLDGRHGLKSGFEVGASLTDIQSKALASFMNWQINTATYQFEKGAHRNEYFETYEWYVKNKGTNCPPRFGLLSLICETLNQSEKQYLESTPFYGVYKDKQLKALDINGNFFETSFENGMIKLIPTKVNYWGSDKYLIRYNELNLQYE